MTGLQDSMASCLMLMSHVLAATTGAAGNEGIGDGGAMALADALAPRQNPDGTWTCNNTLSTLGLDSASCPPPPLPSF